MTDTQLFIVNNDLPADVADEYNHWYVTTHIPQLLTLPGFVSGQRFELGPVQNGSKPTELRRFLSVFEIEGDPAAAFDAMRTAVGEKTIDSAPVSGSVATTGVFVPLGPKSQA